MRAIKWSRKTVLVAVAVLMALALFAWGLRTRPIPVDTADVRVGLFEHVVTERGVTRVKNEQVITAPADGILPRLDLDPGDPVAQGKLLFTFLYDVDIPVRSPVSGVVLEVFKDDRQHLMRGTPILSVGNPRDLEIVSEVLTSQAVRVEAGQPVRILDWGGPDALQGKVDRVEPEGFEEVSALGVDEQRVNVIVAITSPAAQWQGLGAGYQLEINVITARVPDALLVPVGALFESSEGQMSVFVVKENRARRRDIRIGLRGRLDAIVEEGLGEGERVILYPGNDIYDGIKVEERNPLPPRSGG